MTEPMGFMRSPNYKEKAVDTAHVLIANAFMYAGLYVTKADFDSVTAITADSNAATAYRNAQAQGYKDPVLVYIPNEGEHLCHACS